MYISWTEPLVKVTACGHQFFMVYNQLMYKFQLTPIKLSHGVAERKTEKQFCVISSAAHPQECRFAENRNRMFIHV